MAKFRDSSIARNSDSVELDGADSGAEPVHDRSIGSIIQELRELSAEQVQRVLEHQREHGLRFGESAVALGFVTPNDVLQALSQQFHYPYTPEDRWAKHTELASLARPFSAQAEAFRGIRSQIMMRLFNEDQPRKALAVISPDPKDGKSFFAANLAVTLAQLGGKTLLVDADMRGPRQHEIFSLSNKVGLSSILSGRTESKVIQQVTGVPSLFVLPVGATPPNPMELVERPAFGLLIRELISKFDHVVVDTPAAAYGSDASVIAARCGAALILARKDQSRVAKLAEMVSNLQGSPATIAGVILNEY